MSKNTSEVKIFVKNYLETTKPAVRHFFDGLNDYDNVKLPSITQYIGESGMVRMSKSESEIFSTKYKDFFELEFARAVLAGSILQVAYTAINIYSSEGHVTDTCKSLGISNNCEKAKFCIGREVHNIPIGLLIYAGRIQYNHWDKVLDNKIAENVFKRLSFIYRDNLTFDMAYDLNYPELRPVSHYIVRLELKWKAYSDYFKDMADIFK